MTFYRRNLPHLQRDFKPHFVTFVRKRRRVLPDWARVAVVMPDHVHMILTPLIAEVGESVTS